jgi:hypothetical protein
MMSLTPILILAAAQAAAPAAAAGPPAETEATSAGPNQPCSTPYPKDGEQEIVICVERPQGYRIDPDLLEAEREARRKKLKRPERFVDNSCASVGPMGCTGGGINLLAVALGAAQIAKRAVSGENVGELFIADSDPDGYQRYLAVKRDREARRAAEAEALKEKVAEAEATRAE